MPLTLDQLREEMLALPADDRERLISSLVQKTPIASHGLHPAWDAEIERRIQDFHDGKTQGIPWEEVDKELDQLVNRT